MSTGEAKVMKHESDVWSWEFVFREPHPKLRPLVRSYVGFVERTSSPARRIESATDDVVLVINFGAPMKIIDPRRPATEQPLRGSFATGLFDSYVLTEVPSWSYGVEVKFSPLGAFLFYGMPMVEITNEIVELDELWGSSEFVDRLEAAPSWEGRFHLLDEVIVDRFRRARAVSPVIEFAVRRLRQQGSAESVASLAAELGLSQKKLTSQFREQIGLSPKRFARILRFQHVARQLQHGQEPRWVELAHACGYYDQAHFNHEFRIFTGRTPNEYLQSMLPNGGGVLGT